MASEISYSPNDVPTDDARRQMEASRETGRAHLTFLNETIHSFTLQLAVEDLPEVTLEYIRSADVVDSLSMRHPSWTLSHVCRQWRHAIQRCPPCWTNIVLSFDRPAQSIKLALLLTELMKHVRGFPLSVALHSLDAMSPHCIPLILQSCSRWRPACLSLLVADFFVLAEMKHALMGLKTLALDIHDVRSYSRTPNIDTFDDVVQLDELRKDVGMLPLVLPVLCCRVRHLIHGGDGVPVNAMGACLFLHNSAMLESASMMPLPHASKSIGLRRLTLREVRGHAYQSLTLYAVFQGVALPNLTELTLDTDSFATMSHDNFGYGIGSSLRTLNLVVDDFNHHESTVLATILRYTTSLNHIAVHFRNAGDIEAVFSVAGSFLEEFCLFFG
ncbi:hypothetical protein CPB85DRAFT_1323108 [Mucidula mucida]|nr:hypothetical protein CPB85DRAFT_1323108 [Mucidula mucida]